MLIAVTALALMVAQQSELPGAPDATFEQRWESMVVKQVLKRHAEEDATEKPRKHERHRARVAHGCRYGHKVYHGRSWRCRR